MSSAADQQSLLRIAEASTHIACHQDLHHWLQGEIQHFIPHEALISAYGYFDTWQLKLDVVSSLPGVRSHVFAQCEIDTLLQVLFRRWRENGRQPYVLRSMDRLGLEQNCCECPLHAVLRSAVSLLVHGVRDERGDSDCLYIAFNSDHDPKGCFAELLSKAPCQIIDSLIGQIDAASRKFASLPRAVTQPAGLRNGGSFNLSAREQEILEWICKGKTNMEIGLILEISCFTVKNHVQRIFQKIGATNRVHAVSIYNKQLSPRVFLQMLQLPARPPSLRQERTMLGRTGAFPGRARCQEAHARAPGLAVSLQGD